MKRDAFYHGFQIFFDYLQCNESQEHIMVFERVFSTKTEGRIDDDSDEDDGDGEEDGTVSAGGSFPASVLPTEAAFCSSRPEWFSCPSIREDTKQTHTREGRCIG